MVTAVFITLATALLFAVSTVRASPALEARAPVTAISTSQATSYRPYTHYASATYCQPDQIDQWNCGSHCQANPNFKPIATGGDGDSVQHWYVGYDPDLRTIVVAHQGTNFSLIEPVITDADFLPEGLDATLFPGLDSSITVHSGFSSVQAKTAMTILKAVQDALHEYNVNAVTVIGHSLGAAITLLDSVFFYLQLPGVHIKTVGYGMPRVGNQAFADWVDAHLTDLTRINNMEDPVPTLPPMLIGYHHPSGELHIADSGVWQACSGQDNDSELCSTGDVSSVWTALSGMSNHNGPYDGVEMDDCH